MSKPVWVQVRWSESSKFKDNELIPFADFERKAQAVAIHKGRKMQPMEQYCGYYKTKVNVLFDDGNEYECRLDLAPRDTLGFRDHVEQLIRYYENQLDDSAEQDYVVQAYKENYDFLKTVIWE
ncbi:LPD25 domain-containing protein [Legionella drozanskii]|uniref:Large polyvalent protein associated domain-containing protein n=1 Tax=Legionella drozanskii LLAP-1 TaxID=1212489 RepID=A0A0W0SWA0_9GAMM|nr:LPD25 domain-containing protein [Legionella drozanskii]KTC87638.1 hypothetical protein Ldro_1257 [Legionella drozanskii LLAP-1]